MEFESAFKIIDDAIFVKERKHLKDIEKIIIEGTWQSQTYDHIAETSGYATQHIKNEAKELWRRLGKAFGEEVNKKNFRTVVERQFLHKQTVLERQSPQKQYLPLAEQMKALFDALDYKFEKYERWEKNFFEWIIKIPTRRGYDLILVRGIEGEVGINDVEALRQSINQQKTDEGWIVTTSRISKAACQEIEKSETPRLLSYTFDMLLDEVVDFSRYIEWLEAEVKSRKIDRMYVPLACRKDEFNLDTKQKIGVSHYDENDGWIDGYVDIWLGDPAKEHLSILGEFGTGKTWFAFHYAWVCLQRYRDAKKRGIQRPRLPLLITLRDYARALDVENVLADFFFSKHNIRSNIKVFNLLNRMGKVLLIFDGFDEMAAKVDRQKMINNFWELAKVIVPGAKAVLTCRTEHFPEAKEGRALLNAELQASTAKLTLEAPQFEVLELEKFNDEQIRRVLSLQTDTLTVDIVMGNPQLLDLARRPVMTELILEALPDIEAGKPVDMSRVYLYAVRQKMERDIKAERTFTSLADKLYFLCELSWEMLSTDQMSLNYRLFPDRIRRLFSSVVQEEKDLDHWHYDMMGQTMLIRNADGDYTPAHRSLLEFFVAVKFAAELGVLPSDFIEVAQARSDLSSSAAPVDYTWSNYFVHQLDKTGRIVKIPPLKEFKSESFDNLREAFGKMPLSKATIDLLLPILSNTEALINMIEATRGKSEYEVGYVGGNAATVAVKMDKTALEGKDFSGVVVKGTDFTGAVIKRTNFTGANLTDSVFNKVLGSILSVAFSPDGKLLATGDDDGIVRLWDITSGREMLIFKGHTSWLRSVAFSPDGTNLASGSDDQTVRLWNIKTGECLHILQGHTDRVRSVAFSPDGQTLTSGSSDHAVRLWDIKTGECFKILQGHTDWVYSVAFSPDGQTLASGSGDYTVRLWNIKTGECLHILRHTNWARSVAFSPDGQTLASGSEDHTVRLWNVKTGERHNSLKGHTNWVYSVAFSPDGQTLASGSGDYTVRLWDTKTGECRNTLQGHANRIYSVAFSPDGQTLASGSSDHAVRLWDTKTGKCRNTLQGCTNKIYSVAFSPNGQTLASSSSDHAVRLWDTKIGECFKILQGHTNWVYSVVFSSDGQTLASSSDRAVRLWDTKTGECFKILQGHTNWVYSVAFSPNGQILASGSGDYTVRLWNIKTGECFKTLQGHTNWVRSVAFSPDGQILASSSSDYTVRLWSTTSKKCLYILQGHTNWAYSVAFSPDGQILASGSDDGTIKLWDLKTGQCCNTLQGHTNRVYSVAFSPDSQILASGSDDGTIKLWDLKTGEYQNTLHGHANWIYSVAFSPNDQILGSGSNDGTIKLWDLKTGHCLKTLINERPYENMNIAGVKGLTEREIASLKALGAVENKE